MEWVLVQEKRQSWHKNEITASPSLLFHHPLIQMQLRAQFSAMSLLTAIVHLLISQHLTEFPSLSKTRGTRQLTTAEGGSDPIWAAIWHRKKIKKIKVFLFRGLNPVHWMISEGLWLWEPQPVPQWPTLSEAASNPFPSCRLGSVEAEAQTERSLIQKELEFLTLCPDTVRTVPVSLGCPGITTLTSLHKANKRKNH